MSEHFEVGQKVRHPHYTETGEIKYGPYQKAGTFLTGYYLVDFGDDTCRELRGAFLSSIPEQPAFAVGDKVTHRSFGPGVIDFGPFEHYTGPNHYLMRDEEGKHVLVTGDAMEKDAPIKVSDRVRVLDDDGGGTHRFVGRVGVVKKCHGDDADLPYLVEFGDGRGGHGDENGQWNCRAVERVTDEDTYEHDGKVYDLTAKYRDRDLDTVRLKKVGGVVRAAFYGEEPDVDSRPLEEVVDRWGPLTRVTD